MLHLCFSEYTYSWSTARHVPFLDKQTSVLVWQECMYACSTGVRIEPEYMCSGLPRIHLHRSERIWVCDWQEWVYTKSSNIPVRFFSGIVCVFWSERHAFMFNKNTCILARQYCMCSCAAETHSTVFDRDACVLIKLGYMCSLWTRTHAFVFDADTCMHNEPEYMSLVQPEHLGWFNTKRALMEHQGTILQQHLSFRGPHCITSYTFIIHTYTCIYTQMFIYYNWYI